MSSTEYELWLRGCDGSEWPLHGPEALGRPVRAMAGEMTEFYDTPFDATYRARVGGGSVYAGSILRAPLIPLSIDFFGDEWADELTRFRRALHRDRDSELVVRTNRSGERVLTVREVEARAMENDVDPGAEESARYKSMLIAPIPGWRSAAPLTAEWQFDGHTVMGSVTIDNPGNMPAWPYWSLTSPAGWLLPDVDHELGTEPGEEERMIPIDFLPYGRDAMIDTDPAQLTVETTDQTLAPLAHMRGQAFLHPLPPETYRMQLPVAVDPLPALPWNLPYEWKAWIARRLHDLANEIGATAFMQMTPTDVGNRVATWIRDTTPWWVPTIGDGLIANLTGQAIADLIAEHYGTFGGVAGAAAQIRVYPRWEQPW